MTTRWTASQSGWYRVTSGHEPEFLGAEQPEDVPADDLVRVENDGIEVRLYQNSGRNLPLGSTAAIPNGAWVTVPFDHP